MCIITCLKVSKSQKILFLMPIQQNKIISPRCVSQCNVSCYPEALSHCFQASEQQQMFRCICIILIMENLVHYLPYITVKIHSLPLFCLLKEQESNIPQLDACNEASANFNSRPCSSVNIITFLNYCYCFFRKSLLKFDFTSDFPLSVNLKARLSQGSACHRCCSWCKSLKWMAGVWQHRPNS